MTMTGKPLIQKIKELNERQAKIALIELSLTHKDIVIIAVHGAEIDPIGE